MTISLTLSLFLLGTTLLTVDRAHAQQFAETALGNAGEVDHRCSEDSLTPQEATRRLDWADANNILPKDKIRQFRYTVLPDLQVVLDPRPRYPLFGTWDGHPEHAQIWRPEAAGFPAQAPAGVTWLGICRSSCFAPDQRLLTGQGYMPIKDAFDQNIREIVTLAPRATFENLAFQTTAVDRYTIEWRDAHHDILHIHAASGGALRVTPNHTLVATDGTIREASTFQVGDSLVRSDGSPDPIVAIEQEHLFGRVYNVAPVDLDLSANVIVAEGYLNGSARYQNNYANYVGRVLLREGLAADLLP